MPFWWIFAAKKKKQRDRDAEAAAQRDGQPPPQAHGPRDKIKEHRKHLDEKRPHVVDNLLFVRAQPLHTRLPRDLVAIPLSTVQQALGQRHYTRLCS